MHTLWSKERTYHSYAGLGGKLLAQPVDGRGLARAQCAGDNDDAARSRDIGRCSHIRSHQCSTRIGWSGRTVKKTLLALNKCFIQNKMVFAKNIDKLFFFLAWEMVYHSKRPLAALTRLALRRAASSTSFTGQGRNHGARSGSRAGQHASEPRGQRCGRAAAASGSAGCVADTALSPPLMVWFTSYFGDCQRCSGDGSAIVARRRGAAAAGGG